MRFIAAVEEREKQAAAAAAGGGGGAAAMKDKAEQEAKEIKSKAKQEAIEIKAKAEQEAKEIKANAEHEAKEQAERDAAAAVAKAKAEKKSLINSLTEKRLGERSRMRSDLTRLVSMQRTTTEAISRADSVRESGKSSIEDSNEVVLEGEYNPTDYTNLDVSAAVRDLWGYIMRYKSREVELETKLKCFMPEYIPAIGEIDSFIKVPRPDKKDDEDCGHKYLDEPPNVMLTEEEAEAFLAEVEAEVEREAARVVKGSQQVRITGATGPRADLINGMYKPTEEMNDNVTVYVKVNDDHMWLVYNAFSKDWNVHTTADKGTGGNFANCKVPVKCLPQECPVGQWRVDDGGTHVPQSAVTISQFTQNEEDSNLAVTVSTAKANAEEKLLANSLVWTEKRLGEQSGILSNLTRLVSIQRTTTEAISRADSVRESGKSSIEDSNEVVLEGEYNPTDYTNLDVSAAVRDLWGYIMRYKSREVELETKLKCFMPEYIPAIGEIDSFIKVPRPDKKDDEDCGHKYLDEPPNIMLIEEEVEAYLAEVDREAARVVQGSHIVRITGATGNYDFAINGIYKPTEEMDDNVTVYAKVEDDDMWLVYIASSNTWNVQKTADKGTGSNYAYCVVPAKCLPHDCPLGKWSEVELAGSSFVLQPAIVIEEVSGK